MSQANSLGMGGACRIGGVELLVAAPVLVGIRQYVPPKCIVRRLRSVRQEYFEGSLRKLMISCSSVEVTKFR